MTAESTLRAATLAALIARHSSLAPHQVAAHVTHLQRIARQLKAIAERQCNGYLPPGASRYMTVEERQVAWAEAGKRDTDREAKLQTRSASLCAEIGGDVTPVAGGDPRGPCLRLVIEGERGDGWDADSDGRGSYAVY